jgi:signal transduction histidine kinase
MRPHRRQLRHRIFRSLLGVALLSIVLTALAAHLLEVEQLRSPLVDRLASEARLVAQNLPPAGSPLPELEGVLARHAEALRLDIAILDPSGRVLVTTSQRSPPPWSRLGTAARADFSRRHSTYRLKLPDGRRLLVRPRHAPERHLLYVPALVVLLGVLAIGSHRVARRITRRLETLERGVRELGAGTLSTRVPAAGEDEVASLAETFNVAADRIERLVGAQQRMLASASHELRSPLARLRLALELLGERARGPDVEKRLAEGIADIEELDALVEDLLLTSRLEAADRSELTESVDLADLVRAEAERAGVDVESEPVSILGDERLLRRLVRNLLDNAERHAGGHGVAAGVAPLPDGGARVWVGDRGPGVPVEERERIFEPFYQGTQRRPGRGPGVGLGLDLVRRIARHHGGEATCRERSGGGALFEVTLHAGA